jgi:hypothetical protein
LDYITAPTNKYPKTHLNYKLSRFISQHKIPDGGELYPFLAEKTLRFNAFKRTRAVARPNIVRSIGV